MEAEGSLPCLQPATGPYLQPNATSLHLPSLLLCRFFDNKLYIHYSSLPRVIYVTPISFSMRWSAYSARYIYVWSLLSDDIYKCFSHVYVNIMLSVYRH